jgi:hypothetical protein
MRTQQFKLTATPNYSKKTFTIRKYYDDGTILKYRTIQLSPEDFENELMNTKNDWINFLRSEDYYRI